MSNFCDKLPPQAKLAIYVVFLLTILAGCKKDEKDPVQQEAKVVFSKPSDVHVYDNVKNLNQDAVDQIEQVGANEMVFNNFESTDKQINVGDVIVADVSEKLPYGALRKVTKKENSGGKLRLTTSNASLNDVFKYGKISIRQAMGDTLGSSKGGRTNIVSTNLSYTYDRDENPATTSDQIKFDMTGTMDPSFIFEWEKGEGAIIPSHAKISLEADVEYITTVYAAIDKITLGKEPIKKFPFPTIRIPVFGVVIVFRPEIHFFISMEIPNPVDVKFGFRLAKKFVLGGSYTNGEWRGEDSNDLEAEFLPPLSFKDRGTIKSTLLHARLLVYPYGIEAMAGYAGGMFGSDIDLDCNIGQYRTNLWLDAELGFKYEFSFFNGFLEGGQDFNKTYNSFTKELTNGPLPCGFGGAATLTTESYPGGGKYYKIKYSLNPSVDTATGIAYFGNIFEPGAVVPTSMVAISGPPELAQVGHLTKDGIQTLQDLSFYKSGQYSVRITKGKITFNANTGKYLLGIYEGSKIVPLANLIFPIKDSIRATVGIPF